MLAQGIFVRALAPKLFTSRSMGACGSKKAGQPEQPTNVEAAKQGNLVEEAALPDKTPITETPKASETPKAVDTSVVETPKAAESVAESLVGVASHSLQPRHLRRPWLWSP